MYNPIACSPELGLYKMINTVPVNGLLFKFTIEDLDREGVVVGRWDIGVEEVVSVDFGDLSMADANMQELKLVLKPKYCKVEF